MPFPLLSRTLLVAVPAVFLSVAAHAQQAAMSGETTHVALGDLDLSSASGRAAAQARIREAAASVCVPNPDVIPEEVQECVHLAVRSADRELDRHVAATAIAHADGARDAGRPVVAAMNAR